MIMGEVVISSDGEELELQTEEERLWKQGEEETEWETWDVKAKKKRNEGEALDNGLVRWERFLPRIVLRVLLVEADDSTRQIIAALLRKCSYKVTTVSDGLKAWEILRGRPHDIDLILTEVDLPAISGYALLTLIKEHKICKNIPVIMMSTQDSVSTVYKCMLRGAADYLVKPLRKNELRNLWQHVWRRQSSLSGGNSHRDESVGQEKIEATSENNAASHHSNGEMASIRRNKEQVEERSDSQSSCTKPEVEAESAHKENIQELLQPVRTKFSLTDINMQKHGLCVDLDEDLLLRDSEAGGSAAAACKNSNKVTVDKDIPPMDADIALEGCGNNDVCANSPREAIDFMGASANLDSSSNNVQSNFDPSPHLDLSLRRSHLNGSEIQVMEERHTLRHSDASAFTRYTNRPLQPPDSTLANIGNQKELEAIGDQKLSSTVNGYYSVSLSLAPSTQRSTLSLAAGQTKESEVASLSSGQKVVPIQIPVKHMSFSNLCNSSGSVFPPIFGKQPGVSSMMNPSSTSQKEPTFKVNPFHHSNHESTPEQLYDRLGQTANDSTNGSLQKQENNLDSLEDRGRISPATDQSASSSFCNGAASHLNSMGYGSTSGSNNDAERTNEGVLVHNSNSHRSIQREAALTKFRLKRKERCYEKKVRYESRKKLAEQRPRVKGQFVRQVIIDPSPAETDP